MAMKDSRVPWIGEIPYEWQIRPVKAQYSLTTGFTPSSEDDSLYDDEGETWVTISDLKSNIVTDSKQKIAKPVARQHLKEMAKAGSLLYSFKLSVGTVAFAGKDLYTNEAIASFQPISKDADLHFLKYASSLIIGNANTNIYGATIMNQKLILNAPLPVPSLEEQQAIADYLDDRCSKIDEIIAEATASIEEYKELKQAVIYEAVTKGLDKNVPMKDSGVADFGMIPEHWKCVKIARIIENSSSGIMVGPFGSSLTGAVVGKNEGSYKVYGQANLIRRDFDYGDKYVDEQKYEELIRYRVIPGDIAVSMMGTIGKCRAIPDGIEDGIMDSHLIKIRLSKTLIPSFFEYVYESIAVFDQIMAKSTGTIMTGLNSTIVKSLYITVPTQDEQYRIVRYLDEHTNQIDTLISEKQALIEDLQAYKKSLIYEVVTGKRRVV